MMIVTCLLPCRIRCVCVIYSSTIMVVIIMRVTIASRVMMRRVCVSPCSSVPFVILYDACVLFRLC